MRSRIILMAIGTFLSVFGESNWSFAQSVSRNPQQIAMLRWYEANTYGPDFSSGGSVPVGLAFDGAAIWTPNTGSGTIGRIRISDGFDLGGGDFILAVGLTQWLLTEPMRG